MTVRVLVIEDNRANLDLMLYLLQAFGYETASCLDGLSGLEAAKNDDFSVVLTDILMPGIDGFEFARRFKADSELAHIPLVAVTALAMTGDRDRVTEAGFDGYIPKPIDPERFVQQVEAHLPAELRKGSPIRPSFVQPPPPNDGPIVLAVDDLQVNLELIRASLAPFGYRVMDARSAAEALELMERQRPAIVLCDLHMPAGDGFDFITELRAHPELNDIPFVFLSSTAWQSKDRLRGIELGAAKFILRPIEPQKLRQEIEELIGHGNDSHR
ncbi:MAG TPA: response regulator [Candidatus Tyrphobacter sp.]